MPVSFSDIYLVSMFCVPDSDRGLQHWKFPSDLLLCDDFNTAIRLLCDLFDTSQAIQSWDNFKLKVQQISQIILSFDKHRFTWR